MDKLIANLDRLISEYYNCYEDGIRENHTFKKSDPRIAIFGVIGNSLITQLINLKLIQSCLLNKEWWQMNIPRVPKQNIQFQADEYVIQTKTSGYIFSVSCFESGFRNLFRLIFPGKCDNGTSSFSVLYNKFLEDLNYMEFEPLLDFTKEIRNLIHNNGMYMNRVQKNKDIIYREKKYQFIHGEKINFAYQKLFLLIFEDILYFLKQLANDERIRNIRF